MRENLVLVPGLLCHHDLWRDQICAFEEDFNLIIFDHTRQDNLPDMVCDFLTDAPETFNLAGLSMGGYIAFEIMRQAAIRVKKLILLGTNARADRLSQVQMREALITRAGEEDIRSIAEELTEYLIHPSRLKDADLCERILDMASDVGAEGFKRQQHALIQRPDSRELLSGFTCPALIICGEEDILTPPKVHEEMVNLIAGSHYHPIANCGHLSSMECPEEVNELMRKFLES